MLSTAWKKEGQSSQKGRKRIFNILYRFHTTDPPRRRWELPKSVRAGKHVKTLESACVVVANIKWWRVCGTQGSRQKGKMGGDFPWRRCPNPFNLWNRDKRVGARAWGGIGVGV